MNFEERKKFWDTLSSLAGKDAEADMAELRNTIKYPRFLYRYRDVNSKTLEALRTNRMYFSSANYYDDPFDTFLQIDLDRIKKEIKTVLSDNTQMHRLIDFLHSENDSSLNAALGIQDASIIDENTIKNFVNEQTINRLICDMGEFRNILKEDTWSVCFSENGFNETLWLKYAKQHTGFVLIYDLEADDKLLCGKQSKCHNCKISRLGTPLYPIYYSDEKYDATDYARFIITQRLKEKFSENGFINKLLPINYNSMWERERTTLIKKKCHMYDEEWRMIFPSKMKPPIMREWMPSGVILGLKMDINEENLVVNLSKQAGIEHFYKSYIDVNGDLNCQEVFPKN
jgi:hypothetical protein